MELIIISLIFLALTLLGVPLAFVAGVDGLIALFINGFSPLVGARQMFSGLNSFALMAMPFFMLAGEIMNKGAITEKLLDLSDALVGWIKGSLGHVNIVASIFFAGISGSSIADIAALGNMLIPAMVKRGYSPAYSAAITAASSLIGPIIPPSIIMVVYGATVNASIAALFAAGILPGLFLGSMQMIINYTIVKKRGYEKSETVNFDIKNYLKNLLISLKKGILPLIMFLIILGGILGGIFSPTEASGVAVAYAFIICIFVLRTINYIDSWNILKDLVSKIGMVMLYVASGRIISYYLAIERIPLILANHISNIIATDWIFMLVVAAFLVFIGCFMDLMTAIIILGPIFSPIALEFGIHPIQFGMLFVFCINIGLITPPVGGALFLSSAISKVKIEDIVIEILPFYISFIIIILLIIFWSPVVIYIPKLLKLT
jgi:TRAP-type transport system large permease protein